MLVRAGYSIQKLPMANVALVRDDEASPVFGVVADYEQRGTEMQTVFLLRFDLRAQTYEFAHEPIVSLPSTQDYLAAKYDGICHFCVYASGSWSIIVYKHEGAALSPRKRLNSNCLCTFLTTLDIGSAC